MIARAALRTRSPLVVALVLLLSGCVSAEVDRAVPAASGPSATETLMTIDASVLSCHTKAVMIIDYGSDAGAYLSAQAAAEARLTAGESSVVGVLPDGGTAALVRDNKGRPTAVFSLRQTPNGWLVVKTTRCST